MKRVMVVDDSMTARMFIRRCLEVAGLRDAEFIEANNGEEALALLRRNPVDLVVTDLTMPIMDGEALVRRITASPRLNSIPVLVISSASNPAKDKELLDMGALGILSKPVSPTALSNALAPLMKAGGVPA